MRVPLLTAAVLLLLPVIAFTAGRSLLRELFDLTPPSVFAVALTSLATAGSAAMAAHILPADSYLRFGAPTLVESPDFDAWVALMIGFAAPALFGLHGGILSLKPKGNAAHKVGR